MSQKFLGINERPIEYRFVFKHLARLYPKTVLDVGAGTTAMPHLLRNCGFIVTATDNIKDYWSEGMSNRHYHVIDDDITASKMNTTFDFIVCVSVLEHIKDHRSAVRSMFLLLNPGGHILLTFPYNERTYAENVYKLPGSSVREKYPFITQAFSRKEVDLWLQDSGGGIIDQEYWKFYTGAYWTVGDRVIPPVRVNKYEQHQISCVLLRKREEIDYKAG